jgi:hypothetical protein
MRFNLPAQRNVDYQQKSSIKSTHPELIDYFIALFFL